MPTWTAEARQFLEAHRVGHLATSGVDGAPHVVPVCFACDDAAIYFVADEKPKRRPARELLRLRNLHVNPRAALVVDDYDDDWSRLAYLLVRGPAAIVDAAPAHAAALVRLRARYPQYVAMALDDPERSPLLRLEPVRVTFWRATG